MIPRPAECDDDRCDQGPDGRWQHHPGCWEREQTESAEWLDMAAQTALEDGYYRRSAA